MIKPSLDTVTVPTYVFHLYFLKRFLSHVRNLSANSFHFYRKRHAHRYQRQFLSGSLSKYARRVTNEPADRQTSQPSEGNNDNFYQILPAEVLPSKARNVWLSRSNGALLLVQNKYQRSMIQWLDERSGRTPTIGYENYLYWDRRLWYLSMTVVYEVIQCTRHCHKVMSQHTCLIQIRLVVCKQLTKFVGIWLLNELLYRKTYHK